MSKNNLSKIKAIRGMNDILPEQSANWLALEAICQRVFSQYGYHNIRTPLLESTDLFARSIGADTDIVAKEMYTFDDRNGDSLTLRPEGTASCVRAGIEHGLFYNNQVRLWYQGAMYRHERPQKGRYRQFYQIGAEAYGWAGSDIEAEMLLLIASLWQRLGLEDVQLQINSLGNKETRARFREALVAYLQQYREQLDADSQRRLESNPLRILDSKNPDTQACLDGAPSILDFLSENDAQDFQRLQQNLDHLGIKYQVNDRLVRGLDYYNNTVFEWVSDKLGAQATVCAGGRYDGLVEQLGGSATPAFGFAMGAERLLHLLEQQDSNGLPQTANTDIYLVSLGETARMQALGLLRTLTQQDFRVVLHCGEGSFKNQFKKANKTNARLALVIGEQEAEDRTVGVKDLQNQTEQQTLAQKDVASYVTQVLKSL